jgi:hypothetical protein
VSDATLESVLTDVEAAADQALRAAGAAHRDLKRARAAAAVGNVRDLRRSLEAAEASTAGLAEAARELRGTYDFDEDDHLASGAYTSELLAAAKEADLAMVEEDDRLLAYPSLLRVLPADTSIEIDRRKERRLRPSVLVRMLRDAQRRTPRFQAQRFVESLAAAYDLELSRRSAAPGDVVRLADLYKLLTLLPTARGDYSIQEFTRDLYLTDQQGQVSAKDGRVLQWSASSGTRGAGVLTTVSRTGQQQRYWGISFVAGSVT